MKRKYIALSVFLIMIFTPAGYAESKMSRLEMDYSTSYKLAKFNQILNPDAEKNLEPVYGFSGRAAKNAVKRYWGKFEKPPKQPAYTFSIGKGKKR